MSDRPAGRKQGEPPRAVLVSGASRGLGREVAVEFARAGALVGIGYLSNEEAARETEAAVRAAGGEAVLLPGDVGKSAEVKVLVAKFLERSGKRLDVLVHCAGIFRDRRVAAMTDEEWDSVLAASLDGGFHLLRAAARPMMRARAGHVVFVSAIAAAEGRFGGANYAAAKAGLVALMKSAARELGSFGVAVNAVMPGFMPETGMGRASTEKYRERAKAESVLGSLSAAAAAAKFIRELTEMENVSGQVFNLDGRIPAWP